MKYKLEGDTKVNYDLLGALGQNPNQKYDASLDITTPESVDFSVTHQLDDQWTLYAGSTWTRWSRLKEITVENKGVPAALTAPVRHHHRRTELARHLGSRHRCFLPAEQAMGTAYRSVR